MTLITHALTTNGRISGEVKDPEDTPEEILQKRLALLDGEHRYSLSLWRLPDDVPFHRVDLRTWPQKYLQVAGSRERMTVEIRWLEGEIVHHYVVGHPLSEKSSTAEEIISWNGYGARVQATEVFDAAEAAGLFVAYYLNGSLPNIYTLRPRNA